MRRRIRLVGAMLFAVALIAVAAAPASARIPGAKGLVSFGKLTCEGGIGPVEVIGPRGPKAASGYLLISRETTVHVVSTQLTVTFDPVDGDPEIFSKSYGNKTAMTAFTCTQEFGDEEGTGLLEVTVAIVPPR